MRRLDGVAWGVLFLGSVATGAWSATPVAGEVEWRASLEDRIQAAWSIHGVAYQQILSAPPAEDRLGAVTMPALSEAARRGVDIVPLVYELLLFRAAPREAVAPLGRMLAAVVRLRPELLDPNPLAEALVAGDLPEAVRLEVARALAAIGGEVRATSRARLMELLRSEARRGAPSRGVSMALLEGLVEATRGAREASPWIIAELDRLGPGLGLSGPEIVHAAGEIGGAGAEEPVLSYLHTADSATERRWALRALGRVGTAAAFDLARRFASDGGRSGYERRAAIAALGRFTDQPDSADALEAIATEARRPADESAAATEALREMLWRLPAGSAERALLAERLIRIERRGGESAGGGGSEER